MRLSIPTRARRIGALGILVGVALAARPAEPYNFFHRRGAETEWRPALAAEALRWSPESWGPGATLDWEIASDPDFDALFGSPSGVFPHFQEALDAWSRLFTADIRWRATVADEAEGGTAWDGRNTYYIDAESRAGGYAELWQRRDGGEAGDWELVECDFTLGSWVSREIPDPALRESRLQTAVDIMVHELGHCLGLAHTAALSIGGRMIRTAPFAQPSLPFGPSSLTLAHPRDPVMSYGHPVKEPAELMADDAVSASLVRPADGWLERTGSIAGSLRVGEEPAPWVYVEALRLGGEDILGARVGAFSDHEGEFLIEGLVPSDYVFWVHVSESDRTPGHLLWEAAPVDLDDTVAGYPVRVRAGQVAEVRIPMQIGRTSRPPPGESTPGPPAAVSISGQWGEPCSGVRVRASQPYPADGPRAATVFDPVSGGEVWLTTELVMEWTRSARSVVFDWIGLYRGWVVPSWRDRPIWLSPPRGGARFLDLAISDWQAEPMGSVMRHTLEITWPESAEAGLRFRSPAGCGGASSVVCSPAGCGIR